VQAGYRLCGQGPDLRWSHSLPRLGQGGGFQVPDLVGPGQPGGAGADRSEPQYEFRADCHTGRQAGFNATATVPAGYTGQNKSAEVITEAPSEVSGSSLIQLPLADYGQVNYNNATVTSRSGTHGGLSSTSLWNGYAVKMVGSSGATLSTPSGLLNGTNSSGIPVSDFTAGWQAAS